jgi:nucleotide-binding universal stress UspA family protein
MIQLSALTNTPLRFLVCVDSSEESFTALKMACIKARKRAGVIDILHVVEKETGQSLFSVSDKIRQEKLDAAQKMLKSLAEFAEDITGQQPNLLLREGGIGDTIVKTCEEQQGVNLIVLGVAVGGARGKLIAWLASQLGDKLIMPMLLVPGNLTDQQLIDIS